MKTIQPTKGQATCKRTQQLPTLLGRLHVAKSLTGFKLCAKTPNNMQQGVQTAGLKNVTSDNVEK